MLIPQDYSEGWSESSRLAPIQGTLYLHSSFGLLSPSAVAQVARIQVACEHILEQYFPKKASFGCTIPSARRVQVCLVAAELWQNPSAKEKRKNLICVLGLLVGAS